MKNTIQITYQVTWKIFLLILMYTMGISFIFSQQGDVNGKTLKEEVEILKNKIEVLEEEVEKKSGTAPTSFYQPAVKSEYGFGEAASKVYQRESSGISIGGYGEFIYQSFADKRQNGTSSELQDKIDILRLVLYFGYKFTSWVSFNSEIEYEHTSQLGVEFAYLDFFIKDYVNFRAGLILVPGGILNKLHEPPSFLGSQRTQTEQYIIPTTWREAGIGFFGSFYKNQFAYEIYVTNSFNGLKYNSTQGVRGGRQKGDRAIAEDFSGSLRFDWQPLSFIQLGVFGYVGNAGQENGFKGLTSISDFHFIVDNWRGVNFRALVSFATIGDAATINEKNQYDANSSVGSQLLGYYFELGYDLLASLTHINHQLILFVRFEQVDTNFKVPSNFTKNESNNNSIITTGFVYKPIVNIAIKLDYQIFLNKARTGVSVFNGAFNYYF